MRMCVSQEKNKQRFPPRQSDISRKQVRVTAVYRGQNDDKAQMLFDT